MSMQDKTEHSNECNSESDEIILKNKQNPVDFLMVTRMPQKSYKFHWIIQQFSTISKNKELYSSDIRTATNSCYQLKLVKYEHGFGLFHVRKTIALSNQKSTAKSRSPVHGKGGIFGASTFTFGQSTVSFNEISEEIEVKNVNEFTNKLKYQVSATDSKGRELMKWSVCFSDDNESQGYKIGEYKNNTLKYFLDDSLILDCNLQVNLMPTTEEIPISFKPSLECNSWKKLSENFKALYQNSLDTDITLVVGTEAIRAHKLILTARSSVFKKIFQHDMKESEQNSVTITDVEFSALQRLVEFLYTGVIADDENKDLNLQELFDLYYAADKYEVMDLREMVGNTLLGRIQVDNASEILIWSDLHNDKYLKSRLINYISLNFEVVSNEDTWKSCILHHPRLAVEVFSFCVKKINIHE